MLKYYDLSVVNELIFALNCSFLRTTNVTNMLK